MQGNEQYRLRFHAWLVERGLDARTADAILASMPPYDWHELATKADLAELRVATKADLAEHQRTTRADLAELRVATKADLAEHQRTTRADLAELESDVAEFRVITEARFSVLDASMAAMQGQLGDIRGEMAGLRTDTRTLLLAVVGFMLTVVLAGAGTAIGLLT